MNKKGFTLVEVIVSIVLVSVVLSFMLASLVKIKQTYNNIYDEADGDIYSSSISRVINNDINENGGIKYYSCDVTGNSCEFTLGNNQKRKVEIYSVQNGSVFVGTVSEEDTNKTKEYKLSDKMYCETTPVCKTNNDNLVCQCNITKQSTTLEYSNTTSDKKLIYMKTISTKKSEYDNGNVSATGYIFGNMSSDFITFNDTIDTDYENKLSTITIKVFNGIDYNDSSHDITISSSSRYKKDKIKYGDDLTISLSTITDGVTLSDLNVTAYLIERYGKGFYIKSIDTETSTEKYEQVTSVKVPSANMTFTGYYYSDDGNDIKVIDENGKILISNTFFKDKNVNIFAKWE